tara:strand:+ start:91 stop:2139 length:2049 start_codon:yes stop_codon:yes gene_type:complete
MSIISGPPNEDKSQPTRPSVEDLRARRGGIDVVGGMTKDELEQFLNDVNDWKEKLNEKGGEFFDKFAFQVDQFQKTMWDNGGNIINDQLGQVNKEKGNGETKIHSVISFNIYYKEEFLIKMLHKLINQGKFDVICLQEMCGPWLVANKTVKFAAAKDANDPAAADEKLKEELMAMELDELRELAGRDNDKGRDLRGVDVETNWDDIEKRDDSKEEVVRRILAAPAVLNDETRALGENIHGRMLKKEELSSLIGIINGAEAAKPRQHAAAMEGEPGLKIEPSNVRLNEHLAGRRRGNGDPMTVAWLRTIQDLTEYIDDQDRKATLNKGLDVEDIIGGGGMGSRFNSVKWGEWWLKNLDWTIHNEGDKVYVKADFTDKELVDYSIIFAPANHTNGFYLCSFGNAIIYKKDKHDVSDVPTILYSDPPVPGSQINVNEPTYGPGEGRNALKVKIDDINYICMHLDEKSFWKSQVVMLNKWIEERLFDEECIVCGDMNVMDVTINPIKTLLLEGHRDYSIAGDAKLNDEVKGEGQVGEGNKHSDRSKILWNLFAQDQTNKKKLTSIYEKVGGGTHIRTVANGGGVDYVGYSPAYEGIQTGVIYPVLPEDELQEQEKDDVVKRMGGWPPSRLFPTWRGYCISDHWLPFLVFKTIKKTPQTQTQPPPPPGTETAGAEADTPTGDGANIN